MTTQLTSNQKIKNAIKRLKKFNRNHRFWDTEEFSQQDMYDEIEDIISILQKR